MQINLFRIEALTRIMYAYTYVHIYIHAFKHILIRYFIVFGPTKFGKQKH